MNYILVFLLITILQAQAAIKQESNQSLQLPEDSQIEIEANITDIYSWSDKNNRYELDKARFFAEIIAKSKQTEENEEILERYNIQSTPREQSRRTLNIYFPDSAVFNTSKNPQPIRYNVEINDDNVDMSINILFPLEKVRNLLFEALQQQNFPIGKLQIDNIISSKYHCKGQSEQLICSIDYTLVTSLSESLIERYATNRIN